MNGAKVWCFADGYLPEKNCNDKVEAHEALMLFNMQAKDVEVKIDIYFTGRKAVKDISVIVPAEEVKALRLDHPEDLNGTVIEPLTQYALRVRASEPIVVQFGRVDTTQNNLSYYVGVGYYE